MAGKITTSGMDGLLKMLETAEEKAHDICAESLYEGAGLVADVVSSAVDSIQVKRFKYPAPPGKQRMPSPEEKELLKGAKKGVAHFRDDGGSVNTSVGFQNSGYGLLNGKTVPIPLIANAINHGTSFMKKQPFMRKAFSQSKGAAQAAIENKLREELDKLSAD